MRLFSKQWFASTKLHSYREPLGVMVRERIVQKPDDFAFGFRTPERGYTDIPRVNSLDAFKPIEQIGLGEAKALVIAVNHRLKNKRRLAQLEWQYRISLEQSNYCLECDAPIRVKRVFLTDKQITETYGDIQSFYGIHPKASNNHKLEFFKTVPYRVFNKQCSCLRKLDRVIERRRERLLELRSK